MLFRSHIEGQLEGDVRAANVRIGPEARIKGSIVAESIEIAGAVDGKVEAKKVTLTRTAHVTGDIVHQDIAIESGAFLDGQCRPQSAKTPAKPVQPVAPVQAAPAAQPAAKVAPLREAEARTSDLGV